MILREKNKNKPNKLWFVTFTMLGIVILAQLVVSNLMAGKGQKLGNLEKQATLISRENEGLQEELAQKSSLTSLSNLANTDGFEKPGNILYLDSSLPVAQASQ